MTVQLFLTIYKLVSKGKIGSLITTISNTKINELHRAVDFALGFDEIKINYSIS